jgi:hypothetical protein
MKFSPLQTSVRSIEKKSTITRFHSTRIAYPMFSGIIVQWHHRSMASSSNGIIEQWATESA